MKRDRLQRLVPSDVTAAGDGRTIVGRCVPYGKTAVVRDPGGPDYKEMFQYGAFGSMIGVAQRVELRYGHGEGIMDLIGHAITLEERHDGLYGTFRTIEGAVGAQAMSLVRSGVLTHLSVGFIPLRSARGRNGEIVRTACHLDEVSLVRGGTAKAPGYEDAAILAVRSVPRENAQLEDRLAALGIRAPLERRLRKYGR